MTRAEQCRNWRLKNKDKVAAYRKLYRTDKLKADPDYDKRHYAAGYSKHRQRWLERNKTWRIANSERLKLSRRKSVAARRKVDLDFRLRGSLRSRIRHALRDAITVKCDRSINLVGCPISWCKFHLECQFQPGMIWDNYGRGGWEIDHILPCASFDLTDPAQQRACFHWSNLQPLWKLDNIRKGTKLLANQARPA